MKREEKLLLIHRFREGNEYWVFPGGGVEEGETIEAALNREMLEETGLRPVSTTWIGQTGTAPVCIFFACELEPGEPQLGGPELAEQSPQNRHILEWVAVEEVLKLVNLFPLPDKELFERLFTSPNGEFPPADP